MVYYQICSIGSCLLQQDPVYILCLNIVTILNTSTSIIAKLLQGIVS